MSEVQQIRSLAKQAALFRAHGLLPESRGKYEEILSLLGSNHQFQNAEKLAVAVQNRLEDVEYDIRFRDLREKFFDLSERAFLEYSDSLIGCTRNKGYSWMRRGVSWTRTRITNIRLKCGLPGKKRISS
jgi:hypothetical protein